MIYCEMSNNKSVNYYLKSLNEIRYEEPELFEITQIEIFGSKLSWKEMMDQEKENLRKMLIALKNIIALKVSPIDVEKLARAIQNSRSGVGGCAMTKFICNFCGANELWNNTVTPGICKTCAVEMAGNIAKFTPDMLKNTDSN